MSEQAPPIRVTPAIPRVGDQPAADTIAKPQGSFNVTPEATTALGHQASESKDSRPSESLSSNERVCDGELKIISEHGQPHGIRDRGGYVLFFPLVRKYEGQEERYRNELAQSFRLADFLLRSLESSHETGAPLTRATFAKDRNDPCTWVLYLLEAEQISVGKAAEWLREYINEGKQGSLPDPSREPTVQCVWRDGCRRKGICLVQGHCDAPPDMRRAPKTSTEPSS